MKKLLCGMFIALFSSIVLANTSADNQFILNRFGPVGLKTQLGTLVNGTSNLLIAKYSYAVQGGSTTADISLLTDLHDTKSYAVLPNKAIVTNAWLDVYGAVLSSSSATVALKAVSSEDILAATSKGLLGVGLLQGVPAGTTVTSFKLTSAKTVKATVGTTALTAGKFDVYIEYVIGD